MNPPFQRGSECTNEASSWLRLVLRRLARQEKISLMRERLFTFTRVKALIKYAYGVPHEAAALVL